MNSRFPHPPRRHGAEPRFPCGIWKDRSGATALTFAILLVPFAGLAAVALDYSRTTRLRAFVQSTTDGAALAAALEDKPDNIPRILDQARARIGEAHGASLKGVVDLTGEWVGTTDYRVRASMNLGSTLMSALPGLR